MDIWDLLKKKGLNNNSVIQEKIMHDWSITDILDLNEEINIKINPIDKIKGINPPNFQFVANSELSGQYYGGCRSINCRANRIDELNRFASLWADKVYIQSYFDEHLILTNAKEVSRSRHKEYWFRADYLGNILCLLKLKPLILSGIVEIVSGEISLCPHCMQEKIKQCDEISSVLHKQVKELSNQYRDLISAKIKRGKRYEKSGIYTVEINVPEELGIHKTYIKQLIKIPKWLEKRYQSTETDINLTQEDLKKLRIPESEINNKASALFLLKTMATLEGLNSSLWTNSHLEIELLNTMTEINENTNINEVLLRELACELPLILDIPLESLLEIREKEHEAFLVYRDSIKEATRECISKGMNIKDAKQLYQDVIVPKLNSLNLQVKQIKDRVWKNLKIEIGVLATCGVFGLLSNMLAFQIPLLTASGITLADIAKKITTVIGTPDEIGTNDFYFLWKASKKAMKPPLNN